MSNPCEQKDEIRHIKDELANHKVWRKETTDTLTDIKVICATMDARLKAEQKSNADALENKMQRFDDHVKGGDAFRAALILTMIGLAATIAVGFISYGKMEQKVDHLYSQSEAK